MTKWRSQLTTLIISVLLAAAVSPTPNRAWATEDEIQIRTSARSFDPFANAITIEVSLEAVFYDVDVSVFSANGRRVKTLRDGSLSAPALSEFTLTWNGTDDRDRVVRGGMYVIVARLGSGQIAQAVVVVVR